MDLTNLSVIFYFSRFDGTRSAAERLLAACGRQLVLYGEHSKPYLSMGAVFSIFGGLYYWFEKITGVTYSEILAQIHFWTFFVGVNVTFFPLHWLGAAGMPRRIPDYPDAFYLFNKIASWGSYISAASFVFFFVILFEAFYSNRETDTASH
jgi:cytochrome c oxidase subunit I